MNELQLVGYTADFGYLVFSDPDDDSIRFRAAIDPDLVQTLFEVVQDGSEQTGLEWPIPEPLDDPVAALTAVSPAAVGDTPERPVGHRVPAPPSVGARPPAAADPVAIPPVPDRSPSPVPRKATSQSRTPKEPEAPRVRRPASPASNGQTSSLSPREIQALLRAGKTPAVIARQAGVDEERVLRWLPPIEAERNQVILAVQRARLAKPRLGPSDDTIGDAIRRNLAGKGIHIDDEGIWSAVRRGSFDAWTVSLRYRTRGRTQTALWRLDPETGDVEARNPLALEIGWTRSARSGPSARAQAAAPVMLPAATRRPTSTSTSSSTPQAARAGAKKAVAPRPVAGAKKSTPPKPAAKKTSTAKPAPAAKKTAAAKAPPRLTQTVARGTAAQAAQKRTASPAKRAAAPAKRATPPAKRATAPPRRS